MTVEVVKFIHPRVIYVRYSGQWTVQDLATANGRGMPLIESSTEPCHVLVDSLATTSFPMNPKAVTEVSTVFRHPRLLWTVLVVDYADSVLFNMISAITSQLSKVNFKHVKTVDEAIAFLREVDIHVQDLTVPVLE